MAFVRRADDIDAASPGTNAGETIPIRLFLGGFELTPTFRDVNKKFSTRYYLNLVLIDEENRRYFKCVPPRICQLCFVPMHLTRNVADFL